MGWLQTRVQPGEATQYYTIGQNNTILIVGLGNPGAEYQLTRHNLGFMCADNFVSSSDGFDPWTVKKDLKCQLAQGRMGQSRVFVIKPTTFMNLSGEAVQAVQSFYKIAPENIVVLHDELDLNWGQIRTRQSGSAAGHNGLKSIIQYLGENFGRVRIGIGPKKPAAIDGADFVLQKLSDREQADLPGLYREVNALLNEYIYSAQLPNDTRSFLI